MSDLYIGTKAVEAWPEKGKNGEDGYAVVYADGYKSWSPKSPFEEAYKPLKDMFPVKDLNRIMEERSNLYK